MGTGAPLPWTARWPPPDGQLRAGFAAEAPRARLVQQCAGPKKRRAVESDHAGLLLTVDLSRAGRGCSRLGAPSFLGWPAPHAGGGASLPGRVGSLSWAAAPPLLDSGDCQVVLVSDMCVLTDGTELFDAAIALCAHLGTPPQQAADTRCRRPTGLGKQDDITA